MRDPSFTLTAGPTAATPRTLQALGQPIIFDYDPVFLEKFRELERKVGELMRSSDDIVLMQGEAVLGLEAAARALTRPGMKALNLVSGVYAAWFGDWLREYGAEVVEVRVPYDEAVDADDVRRALDEHPDVELVAVVQSETPSGIHNPVGEIAPLVRDAGALLLVDAVSALGCEEVLVDEWGIDVCVAGPQKCLAGPPGMSLMSISAAAWEAMERNPNAPRGSFVSLLDWKQGWVDSDRTKFLYTPSVVDVNGVDSVVDQVLDEGLDDVHRPTPDGCARRARGRAGDGARALGAPRGLRGRLRHGDPGAGRASRAPTRSRTSATATASCSRADTASWRTRSSASATWARPRIR